MYWIDIELENNTSKQIATTIPKGTVFEVESETTKVQCLVVAKDVTIKLPRGRSTVKLPALCMNRDASEPRHAPGRLTAYCMTAGFSDQEDVWRSIGGRGKMR